MATMPAPAEKKAITIFRISPSRQANTTLLKTHKPELLITKDEEPPSKTVSFNSAEVKSPFLDDKLLQKMLQHRREKAASLAG